MVAPSNATFRLARGLLCLFVVLALTACDDEPLLAPTGSTVTVTAPVISLPLNGTTSVVAQVVEPSGTAPHQGTRVTFTTSLGALQPSAGNTDFNGNVHVTFFAGGTAGTATITASSGSSTSSGTSALRITIGAQ